MSLATFADELGSALGELASAAGVSLAFAEMVSLGVQPLPVFVARRIATNTGIPLSTILTAVSQVTPLRYPLLTRARYVSPPERRYLESRQ